MNLLLFISIIILILVIIYLIYRYFSSKKNSPILFKDVINGAIKNNNLNEDGNSYPYKHLINSDDIPVHGDNLSFGYSFWLYIDNIGSSGNWENSFMQDKQLINRGDSPSIYYRPNDNTLLIKIKTGKDEIEIFTIHKTLKSQKWIHVCVSLDTRNLDVYLDGLLNKSFILKEVPKLNNNDIYIFDSTNIYAEIAYFRYFKTLLTPKFVESIYKTCYFRQRLLMGPRNDQIASDFGTSSVRPYPLFLWWLIPWNYYFI